MNSNNPTKKNNAKKIRSNKRKVCSGQRNKRKAFLRLLMTFALCCFCFVVNNEWKVSMQRCWMPKFAQSDAGKSTENQEEKNFQLQEIYMLMSALSHVHGCRLKKMNDIQS